jgi:hypothetical protein
MPYPSGVGLTRRPPEREEAVSVPDPAPRRPIASAGRPDDAPLSVDGLPESEAAAPPELARDEHLLGHLRGIGSSMYVTTERIVVARDGRERRPRTGVQSFALEEITQIRLEPGVPPSGRIAVWIGPQEVVSMFFDARSRDQAQEVVELVRPAIARHRRRRDARPRHPSS